MPPFQSVDLVEDELEWGPDLSLDAAGSVVFVFVFHYQMIMQPMTAVIVMIEMASSGVMTF